MTAVVLASILLTIPFMVAFIGIPLWMTFKRPETGADHTGAQRYLRAGSPTRSPSSGPPPPGPRSPRSRHDARPAPAGQGGQHDAAAMVIRAPLSVILAAASAWSTPRQARWSRRPMTKANPYSTPITISRKR